MIGYIKMHRSFLKWEWYDDASTKLLFLHLLLTVEFEPTRYRGYPVPAGARVCGYPALATETGLSVQRIRTAIKKLKATGSVTVQTTPNFSIISITNWNKYQAVQHENNSQATGSTTVKQQAANSQATTSKEEKKLRREEERNIPPTPQGAEKPKTKKGTRIPENWKLDQDCTNYALKKGYSFSQVGELAEDFRLYWQNVPGAKGLKLSWATAWQSWVRKDIEYKGDPNARNHKNGNQGGRQHSSQEPRSFLDSCREASAEYHRGAMEPHDTHESAGQNGGECIDIEG